MDNSTVTTSNIDRLKALVESRNRIAERLRVVEQDINDYGLVAKKHPGSNIAILALDKVKRLQNAKIVLSMCIDKLDICIQKDRNGEDYSQEFAAFVKIVNSGKKL